MLQQQQLLPVLLLLLLPSLSHPITSHVRRRSRGSSQQEVGDRQRRLLLCGTTRPLRLKERLLRVSLQQALRRRRL